MGRPSNCTVPSLAALKPAMISSSVDLPQPDGPTTAKNSPRRSSRSIGPSACSAARSRDAGNVLFTPRSATCGAPSSSPLTLLDLLQIVGQEARVDELVVVDV